MPDADLPRLRFELEISAPYSLALTAERLARFVDRVNVVRDGAYQRLLWVDGEPLLVRAREAPRAGRPRLAVELVGGPARRRAARLRAQRLLERVLGTRHELRAFYRALGGDPLLAAAIRQSRGLSIAGFGDLFEALVTAILTQQVNLIFAYSIRDELVGAFGRRARVDGEVRYAFPEPARLARAPLERLRGMRLSGAKALALQGVARAFTRGELSEAALEALDDEQAIARLCELRGVGRWTAETALIRGLGRRDVFPAGDLGVIKYLAQGLLGRDGRAPEAEMRAFAERWRPYRAYALVYAYAELARRRRP